MSREFTDDEANRHNALTKRGWSLIRNAVLIDDGRPPRPLGMLTRWRLGRARSCFERALRINPDGWSSMWALGKIEQRLGNDDAAVAWFGRAYSLNPGQVDVAREAGLSALDAGRVPDGVAFCEAAVGLKPQDGGLLANLALAYCMAARDDDAKDAASAALERGPRDEASIVVRDFVSDVASGVKRRPERLRDAFPE